VLARARGNVGVVTSHNFSAAIDALVFDLDGTLWDTCAACAVGWNRVLQRHAIPWRTVTAEDVRAVAGKPHDVCIRESFAGLAETSLRLLIEHTQAEDNLAVRELGGSLYPGVADGLRALAQRYPLFIVSNCQAGYIEVFLETSGLASLFADFECWGNTGRTKAENLRLLMQRNQLRSPLFVGDTPGDQQAAAACEVRFAHVSYGFGACEGALIHADSFTDLVAQVT
jgi:phosphoglycolate phosphatase